MAGLYDERTGGLVTHWKSISAITTLVGSGTSARIYPQRAKQKAALPYIEYLRGGGQSEKHHDGVSGHRLTLLYVYCYGATLAAADALAEAVRQNTANYRGDMSGVYVRRITCDDALDDGVDEPIDDSYSPKYWVRVIFRIAHAEAVGL